MATYYVDFTNSSGVLTGTWTFTNASTSVTAAADGDAQTELADGDYIRQSDGTQWYKVNGEPSDADTIAITPAFQQATHTDDAGASLYNAEAGTAIGTAHAHPQQSVDVPPAAGESIKLRANQVHQLGGVGLNVGSNGGLNANIVLVGCSVADDPFSDASDVKPILDANSAATFTLSGISDDYWTIRNLEIIGGTYSALTINTCNFWWVDNCKIHGNAVVGLRLQGTDGLVTDCEFYDNGTYGLYTDNDSFALIEGGVFNGGVGGTLVGLYAEHGNAHVKNSTFGVTTEHDTADISFLSSMPEMHNVTLDSTTPYVGSFTSYPLRIMKVGDYGQVRNGYLLASKAGEVSYSVAVERSGAGGTAWSMLSEPSSSCGVDFPLYTIGSWLIGFPLYLDGTAQTITIYAYADSTAGGWTPNASEFYMEIEHEQSAGVWAKDVSVDTFAAEDAFEAWSITLTPNSAGLAYLRVILKDYAAGGKIYVDPTPVFS